MSRHELSYRLLASALCWCCRERGFDVEISQLKQKLGRAHSLSKQLELQLTEKDSQLSALVKENKDIRSSLENNKQQVLGWSTDYSMNTSLSMQSLSMLSLSMHSLSMLSLSMTSLSMNQVVLVTTACFECGEREINTHFFLQNDYWRNWRSSLVNVSDCCSRSSILNRGQECL